MLNNWILIADGGQARLLQQSEDATLHELESFRNSRGRREPRELESDRAGQAAPGHTMEHTDPQRHAQQRFAQMLAEHLNDRETQFDNLIVVAAPKTLGDLRHHLSRRVQQKVHLEVDRDWTHMSLHELPEHLQRVAFPGQ